MDETRREAIAAAAVREHDARQLVDALMMMNQQVEPEKAREQAIRNAIARANWADAHRALDALINPTGAA